MPQMGKDEALAKARIKLGRVSAALEKHPFTLLKKEMSQMSSPALQQMNVFLDQLESEFDTAPPVTN